MEPNQENSVKNAKKQDCQHFSCCLKTEPTPLSENFQHLRKQLKSSKIKNIQVTKKKPIKITEDMIVGDIINNFPETKKIFEDANFLGLASSAIFQESISLFLAGTGIDSQLICQELNLLISKNKFTPCNTPK